jgi:hypothetical protein
MVTVVDVKVEDRMSYSQKEYLKLFPLLANEIQTHAPVRHLI